MTTLQIIEIANTNNAARKAAKTAKLQKNKNAHQGTILQQLKEEAAKENPDFLSVLEKTEKDLQQQEKNARIISGIEKRLNRVEILIKQCRDPKKFEWAFREAREEVFGNDFGRKGIFGVTDPDQRRRLEVFKEQLRVNS